MWWYILVISSLRRLRQEDCCNFKRRLGYIQKEKRGLLVEEVFSFGPSLWHLAVSNPVFQVAASSWISNPNV